MIAHIYTKPRRVLFVWMALLAVGMVGLVAFNLYVQHVAQTQRASDFRSHLSEADALMRRNNLAGALREVSIAKSLAPEEPQTRKVAGDVYYYFERFEQAIGEYRKSIELGSRQQGVRTNLLWALIEIEQYAEAASFGEKALLEGWTSPLILRYTAEALWRNEEYEKALPYYERAREGFPSDLYVLEHLKRAYQFTGDTVKANQVDHRIRQIQANISGNWSTTP